MFLHSKLLLPPPADHPWFCHVWATNGQHLSDFLPCPPGQQGGHLVHHGVSVHDTAPVVLPVVGRLEHIAWDKYGNDATCQLWVEEVTDNSYDFTVYRSEI